MTYLRELLDRSAYREKAAELDRLLGRHVTSLQEIDNLPVIVGSNMVLGVDVYQLAAELRNLALVPSGESQPEEVAEPPAEVKKAKPRRKATKAASEDGGKK